MQGTVARACKVSDRFDESDATEIATEILNQHINKKLMKIQRGLGVELEIKHNDVKIHDAKNGTYVSMSVVWSAVDSKVHSGDLLDII
ncbi:MAG: hypothetical protein WCO55_03020 [Candidatus Falkowbacteria bacterium]